MKTEILYTDGTIGLADVAGRAVDLLQAGEVVALPTETVYGLAADALNAEAVGKIFEVKGRPANDPLIVHLPDLSWLDKVAVVPEDIREVVDCLAGEFWPGALTMVFPKKECIPDVVTSGLPAVAVRISAHPVFKAVIGRLGRPLAAPSANRFGRISPTSAAAVEAELADRIPLIVDGGACHSGLESTIIKIEPSPTKPYFHVLRAGPVTREMLRPYGKVRIVGKLSRRAARAKAEEDAKAKPEVPGQMASHYAPQTPLRIIDKPGDFVAEPGRRYGLLSFRGKAEDGLIEAHTWEQVEVLSPGAGKLPEAAVRFYHLLRKLDEAGLDELIAEPLPERELGVALMDRLRRAAHGF